MKSVLISIQPYWVFLIIAKTMGWNIDKVKTIEVRKNYPKDESWDKTAIIYCSKDKKSFNRIPKEYQPLMAKFLGKVVGKWFCDKVYDIIPCFVSKFLTQYICGWEHGEEFDCLSFSEMNSYLKEDNGYGWHISDLVIYDKPKELSEFMTVDLQAVRKCENREQSYFDGYCNNGGYLKNGFYCKEKEDWCDKCKGKPITRPPQSWCYVEGE